MPFKLITILLLLCFESAFSDSLLTLIVERSIGKFEDAISFSHSSTGEIYIIDAGSSSLISIDIMTGKIKSISGKGWGELEFNSPQDICATSVLDIFVADLNNHRVQQYDRSLNYISTIPNENLRDEYLTFQPISIAYSQEGLLLILDKDEKQVLKYELKSGKISRIVQFTAGKGSISSPRDITMIDKNKFAILDGKRVVIFDIYGNYIFSYNLSFDDDPNSISSDWKTIAVTSPTKIILNTKEGKYLSTINQTTIIGNKVNELRDVAIIGNLYFVLTSETILICKKAEK